MKDYLTLMGKKGTELLAKAFESRDPMDYAKALEIGMTPSTPVEFELIELIEMAKFEKGLAKKLGNPENSVSRRGRVFDPLHWSFDSEKRPRRLY
ncbi:MAG: hypothetical protein Q8Q42_01330 [Nanoarchaeota archaeon]|nr:hypothetical protein [Nanoarchaeota archaeon]